MIENMLLFVQYTIIGLLVIGGALSGQCSIKDSGPGYLKLHIKTGFRTSGEAHGSSWKLRVYGLGFRQSSDLSFGIPELLQLHFGRSQSNGLRIPPDVRFFSLFGNQKHPQTASNPEAPWQVSRNFTNRMRGAPM